ncbi:MAG: LysM peptidoglycan-binding domain-containing M23 family metallopeptidase [Anaerolineae bacterium]
MNESQTSEFWESLKRVLHFRLSKLDRWFITRISGHLTLVALLIIAASFTLPKAVGASPYNPAISAVQAETLPLMVRFTTAPDEEHYLEKSSLPYTSRSIGGVVPLASSERSIRTEIVVYKAQAGDVIDTIAAKFGLKTTTIMYSNPDIMAYPDALAIDQEVRIPPVDGAVYTVQDGDSLQGIADTFQVTTEVITQFASNNLDSNGDNLASGQELVIPGGVAPKPPAPTPEPVVEDHYYHESVGDTANVGTGTLEWPTNGLLSQDCYDYHIAIDIANSIGTPIYAADSGYVSKMDTLAWSYGWYIMIDHGNGIVTRYAHLSAFNVSVGQSVSKGELIGWMGSTGKSTGPHLHFEVIVNGKQVCPWGYLPG